MQYFYLSIILLMYSTCANAQLSATMSSTNPTCANNNGTAGVTATGGNGYTYKWSTGATSASLTGLSAGTYTVTVYSAGGTQWDTVYFETFEGVHNWTLNTSTGTNGADNNYWVVGDDESGMSIGTCGAGGQSNKTLHITSVAQFAAGAAYDAGGLCGLLYCPQTNMAASSPNINTTGKTNLVLQYDFIGAGQGTVDNASTLLSSNGGANYTTLDASLKSNNSGCGIQGKWTQRSYSLNTSYNGVSNLRIRFNWTNNDDGVGTDPSVAINNVLLRDSIPTQGDSVVKTVTLTLPAGPDIASAGAILTSPYCGQANGSISGLSISGGSTPYSVQWLNGSGGVVGNGYSLTNVPGGFYVFEVTDASQCKDTVQFSLISNGSLPPFNLTLSKTIFCPGDSSQLCAPANYASYQWSNGATTSCIWVKSAGNYKCTVSDQNNCTGVSNTQPVNLYNVPQVSISIKGDTLTAFGGVSYQWFFNGNPVIGATSATLIATANGTYAVLLIDENGCSNISEPVNVVISAIEHPVAEGLQISPNPFSEYVSLQCHMCNTEKVVLYDRVGSVVLSTSFSDGNEVKLSTATLPRGVYFVRIGEKVFKLTKQ